MLKKLLVLMLLSSAALAASPDQTVVMAPSSAVITDGGGNTWGISAGACSSSFPAGSKGPVTINGTADANTCSAVELAYVAGAVWHKNASASWYTKSSPTGVWSGGTKTSPLGGVVVPPPPPPAPAAVLTWDEGPMVDAAGHPVALSFNVYRGPSVNALTKLTNVPTNTFTDPAGSTTPTTWWYAVTATCAVCTESGESPVISVVLAAPKLQPPAPSGLKSQ